MEKWHRLRVSAKQKHDGQNSAQSSHGIKPKLLGYLIGFLTLFLAVFCFLFFVGPKRQVVPWMQHEPFRVGPSAVIALVVALSLTAVAYKKVG
jgi:hypothetical protein